MQKRKGAAFLIVVILSAFILLLAGLLGILSQAYYKNQAQNLSVNKALAIAEEGLAALTNPSTPYTYDTFVNDTTPVVAPGDSHSFYWTKVVWQDYFLVNRWPLNPPQDLDLNSLDVNDYIIYDIYKVYSVGVVTNGQVTEGEMTSWAAAAKNENNATGISVSSVRVIASTVVEKESGDEARTLAFVPNATANLPEIPTTWDGNSATWPGYVPEGQGHLPRKADWQETDLTHFLDPTAP